MHQKHVVRQANTAASRGSPGVSCCLIEEIMSVVNGGWRGHLAEAGASFVVPSRQCFRISASMSQGWPWRVSQAFRLAA